RIIGNIDKVPVIAELMPTRWTYEALIVSQFKDNRYSSVHYTKDGRTYFQIHMDISRAEFNKVHRIKALRDANETLLSEYRTHMRNLRLNSDQSVRKNTVQYSKLELLKNELSKMSAYNNIEPFIYIEKLLPESYDLEVSDSVVRYLDRLDRHFSSLSNSTSDIKDRFYNANSSKLKKLEEDYFNYKLQEIVTKPYERKKILEYKNSLIQNIDPVYLEPDKHGPLGFRTHFYAPSKYIFSIKVNTFTFNIILVLFSTLLLYALLYYELLGKIVNSIGG
ncbi:MAG: hypothetical protein HZB98_00730, partial [Bacteroidia bacterium]|nr:hypothetical protein [Bacteroidia bacterium]